MLRPIFSVLLALDVARAATFNVNVTTVGHAVPSTLISAYVISFLSWCAHSDDPDIVSIAATVVYTANSYKTQPSNKNNGYVERMERPWNNLAHLRRKIKLSSLDCAPQLAGLGSRGWHHWHHRFRELLILGCAYVSFHWINVVPGMRYTGSFFYRFPAPPAAGPRSLPLSSLRDRGPPATRISSTFTVGFQSSAGTTVGSTTAAFTSSAGWKQVNFSFTPTSMPANINNHFVVSLNGATVAGLTIEFAMLSVFPPTFNNRANEMRLDISNALKAMPPAFFRFPGGNNCSTDLETPNLISFTPNTLIRSTSYYVQQMFGMFKGDTYLDSTTNTAASAVQWSAINTVTTCNTVVFTLPFTILSTAGTATVLSAATGTMNTPTNPNAAVPKAIMFTAGKTIMYVAPALLASALIVNAH
ncbi:hypothetical protein DFH09DRAFT_1327555 [Mycena vulgaris]|nr:hypothetical protein DFH09DRAFT_1327555 [Mycena vulgaris]